MKEDQNFKNLANLNLIDLLNEGLKTNFYKRAFI